jgi:hypothetical protein
MSLAVDQPIINNPYQEPTRWWDYQEGQPVLKDGRRPAGYYLAPRTRARAGAIAQEEFVPLESVNEIRRRLSRCARDRGNSRCCSEKPDEERSRRTSDTGATGRIAVKVINHYGDEVLKVYEV